MKRPRLALLTHSGIMATLLAAGMPARALPSPTDELPALPAVRLADHRGSDHEADSQRSAAEQVAALIERAAQAGGVLERAELQLKAANLILAVRLEPACTRALLGLPVGQTPGDLSPLFEQADRLLQEAEESLSHFSAVEPVPGADDAQARKRAKLADVSQVLQAFVTGLEAYLLPVSDTESRSTARKAASGLAILLEHDDQAVAAAASLWYAALRARDGEPERVLAFVPLTLKEPGHAELPYAFFSRLLRCRLLAARADGATTALALLYQLEERCNEWLSDPAQRAQAYHAASLVELQILAAWHARLSQPEDQAARQWCRDQLAAVTAERFADPSVPVYRLVNAIPTLLPLPGADEQPGGQPEVGADGRGGDE